MARKQVVTSVNTREEQSCRRGDLQWPKKETVCVREVSAQEQRKGQCLHRSLSVSTLRDSQLSVLISNLWHQPLDSAVIWS